MGWLVSLKIVLISIGVVGLALAMKLYVLPLVSELGVANVPVMWSSCKSLLRPPYLYFVINAIIITIAASSIFHNDRPPHRPIHHLPPPHIQDHVAAAPPVVDEQRGEYDVAVVYGHEEVAEVTSVVVMSDSYAEANVAEVDRDVSKLDDVVLPAAKPLVSSRFSHRKPARSTLEGGRQLRVSKAPKRHDTLESTWKTITEGRPIPLSRHIKKTNGTSDHHHGRQERSVNVDVEVDDDSTSEAVSKSKTFKEMTKQQKEMTLEAVSSWSPAAVRLRKEPSLSQDELNRRVEAFIHKFNEDMRLQRQESLNQFMEMINRGSN